MRKLKIPPVKTPADRPANVTGTYVYDRELDRVVKVSDRIPSVSSKGEKSSSEAAGPCGRSACGGGVCAGGGLDE